jgi:hypothetical protein
MQALISASASIQTKGSFLQIADYKETLFVFSFFLQD